MGAAADRGSVDATASYWRRTVTVKFHVGDDGFTRHSVSAMGFRPAEVGGVKVADELVWLLWLE